jgi:hypothetical protein
MEMSEHATWTGSPEGEETGVSESISAAMMSGSSAGRARSAAASFTAGGIEASSVSREAGQPLIPNQGEIDAVFEAGFVASENLEYFRCDPDFPTVQLLQYLSFLPAIFRGLLQKLRRSLR